MLCREGRENAGIHGAVPAPGRRPDSATGHQNLPRHRPQPRVRCYISHRCLLKKDDIEHSTFAIFKFRRHISNNNFYVCGAHRWFSLFHIFMESL